MVFPSYLARHLELYLNDSKLPQLLGSQTTVYFIKHPSGPGAPAKIPARAGQRHVRLPRRARPPPSQKASSPSRTKPPLQASEQACSGREPCRSCRELRPALHSLEQVLQRTVCG